MTAEFVTLLRDIHDALSGLPWSGMLTLSVIVLVLVGAFLSVWQETHPPAPPPPQPLLPGPFDTRVDDPDIERLRREGLL